MRNFLESNRFLLLLAFIEGGAVMACELLSAKMVAPFFGSSLYVWAGVLGITLAALMSGYFSGGYISEKKKESKNILFWVLMLAGVLLCLMPFISFKVLSATLGMEISSGVIVALMVFMFPPLLLMSMSSPLIIAQYNQAIETSGKTAGTVYAVSTMGGIFATFLTGFYLMPVMGIKTSCLLFGLALVLFSAIGLFTRKSIIAPSLIIALLINILLISGSNESSASRYKVVYEVDGILGQLKVVDTAFPTYFRGVKPGRLLLVNNTAQTILDLQNPQYSLWDYSYYFPASVSMFPKESDVLLLGLGGGTFLRQFQRLGFNVDVVELDRRIKEIAIEYFFIDPATNVKIDDARHFLNTCDKKYDIITFDLFYNETPPFHVMTKESFEITKRSLKEGGVVMINFYGYVSGPKGKATRCLLKTLEAAGFNVEMLPTPGEESHRNLVILASLENKNYSNTYYTEPGLQPLANIQSLFLDKTAMYKEDGHVLYDNTPELEVIYLEAAVEWRKIVNEFYTERFLKSGVKFW